MGAADALVDAEWNRQSSTQQPLTPGPSSQPQTPPTSAGPTQCCRTTSTTTNSSQTQAPPRTNPPCNTSQTYRTTTTPQAPQLSPQPSTSSQHAYWQAAPSVASSSTAPTPSGSGRQSRRTQGKEPEYTGLDDPQWLQDVVAPRLALQGSVQTQTLPPQSLSRSDRSISTLSAQQQLCPRGST